MSTSRGLLALAASAFVVLAAEPLYLLVDTIVVGHLGVVALGALGIGVAVLGFVTLIGTFVEYGTTARSARLFGAGDQPAAVNEGVQASWLAVGLGLVIVAVAELFAHPLVRLLAGHNPAIQHAAEGWFRIAVLGVPGILLVLAGNGWMRGVQRTREPVRIVLIANGLSALASPILVYVLHLGLNGSAIANVGAQFVGSVLFLRALRRAARDRRRVDWGVLRLQVVLGRDLILRQVGFQVAFLTAAGVAARMGAAQVAAHQIGLQLWEFSALLLDSFAIAAQSLVGAALGSADRRAARATAWQVARYGLGAGLVFAVVLLAGWFVIPALFTSSPLVRHQAHLLWPYLVGMQPVAGVLFALDGVLIGAGDVGYLRTLTLVGALLVFAPLNLAALHWQWGIAGVWFGLSAFIVFRFAGMIVRVRSDRWLVIGT